MIMSYFFKEMKGALVTAAICTFDMDWAGKGKNTYTPALNFFDL